MWKNYKLFRDLQLTLNQIRLHWDSQKQDNRNNNIIANNQMRYQQEAFMLWVEVPPQKLGEVGIILQHILETDRIQGRKLPSADAKVN